MIPAMSNEKQQQGWIGVDLDGTLAEYDGWKGAEHIGEPIPRMVDRVRDWLAAGMPVKILTARVSPVSLEVNNLDRGSVLGVIHRWCMKHIGTVLPVTHEKDLAMVELWDDRCIQVIPNTGLSMAEVLKWTAESVSRLENMAGPGGENPTLTVYWFDEDEVEHITPVSLPKPGMDMSALIKAYQQAHPHP